MSDSHRNSTAQALRCDPAILIFQSAFKVKSSLLKNKRRTKKERGGEEKKEGGSETEKMHKIFSDIQARIKEQKIMPFHFMVLFEMEMIVMFRGMHHTQLAKVRKNISKRRATLICIPVYLSFFSHMSASQRLELHEIARVPHIVDRCWENCWVARGIL